MGGADAYRTSVSVPLDDASIAGDLTLPASARGVVLFAHGSGSSRFSSRNRFVADQLNASGLGTLLIDLLTAEEEESERRTRHLRFDIELLAGRLGAALDWLAADEATRTMAVGCFGASTGAAAALSVAAIRPGVVRAVVSRGGRPDLTPAGLLATVQAPTLLIVGGNDGPVIDMNRDAQRRLRAPVELEIVPGASHLFEESGTLEQVADLASTWFTRHLSA